MTDKKTPEQRASDYAECKYGYPDESPKEDFFAGRADFIQNDLPKLLEMARELAPLDLSNTDFENEWLYSIRRLLAMAEKGET